MVNISICKKCIVSKEAVLDKFYAIKRILRFSVHVSAIEGASPSPRVQPTTITKIFGATGYKSAIIQRAPETTKERVLTIPLPTAYLTAGGRAPALRVKKAVPQTDPSHSDSVMRHHGFTGGRGCAESLPP